MLVVLGIYSLVEWIQVRQIDCGFQLEQLDAEDVFTPKDQLFFHLWERDYRRVYWKDNRPVGPVQGPRTSNLRFKVVLFHLQARIDKIVN